MGCEQYDKKSLVRELQERVIKWAKTNWSPYPWRMSRDPYTILIAEFMLKRTTRQAVEKEYNKIINKFPDLESIANASEEDLRNAFRPIGLYEQRAKQIKKLAEHILAKHKGAIPNEWDALISLPGVGEYIAGAILSFGFGKRVPVIDSNVKRLFTRITGLDMKRSHALHRLLDKLLPKRDYVYFNYGLIDLGNFVCHYKTPRCEKCPLTSLCVYFLTSSKFHECAEHIRNIYRSFI